jgi:hypothetical protein
VRGELFQSQHLVPNQLAELVNAPVRNDGAIPVRIPRDQKGDSLLGDTLKEQDRLLFRTAKADGRGRMSLAFSALVHLNGNREIECIANSCGNGPKKAVSRHFSLLSK